MFIAALFTIAKTWLQLKCPSAEDKDEVEMKLFLIPTTFFLWFYHSCKVSHSQSERKPVKLFMSSDGRGNK